MSQLKVNMQINFAMVIMVINHIHSLLAQKTHNISYQMSPSDRKNTIIIVAQILSSANTVD